MFSYIWELIAYVLALFFVTSVSRTVVVPRLPKQAPHAPNVDVFTFSVRGGHHHDDINFLQTPALVSDPATWDVSMNETGILLYRYDKDIVVMEQQGKILATFQILPHGLRNTKIVIKTVQPSDITNWGGGLAWSNNDHATVEVGNRRFTTAGGFFNAIGVSIFVVSRNLSDSVEGGDPLIIGAKLPIYWTKVDSKTHEYFIGGEDVDIYVSYDKNRVTQSYLRFLWGISGKPSLPPLYSLGFMAGRWGWESRSYISNILDQFDLHDVAIDAFIMDFEWYLNITGGDYLIPPNGLAYYPDFRFGNVRTFPDVGAQSEEYRSRNIKFGGIRKPRLGDSDLIAQAQAKGWTLMRNKEPTRDLNFALRPVQEWYGQKTKEMLDRNYNLPDFFWNDEGETSYYTYHHWIEAEQLSSSSIVSRRFSLNRAFTPGMQRLEASAVWTGDVETTWESLRQNVDALVRWSEAGAPLVTFDTGGFFGKQDQGYEELLVRWYQLAVFSGVMRVHSTLENKPHFPFVDLWGESAASAMREAVQFRYRLIPTIVAAMHSMREDSAPWIERSTQYQLGQAQDFLVADRKIFVVPVLTARGNNTYTSVNFPGDSRWYLLEEGPIYSETAVKLRTPDLNKMHVFAREGTMILLHGGPMTEISRTSDFLEGGHTLLIKAFVNSKQITSQSIYSVTLVEDDGQSRYGPVRKTVFTFNQDTMNIAWITSGSSGAPRWYTSAEIVVRFPDGQEVRGTFDLTPNQPTQRSRSLRLPTNLRSLV